VYKTAAIKYPNLCWILIRIKPGNLSLLIAKPDIAGLIDG